MEVLLLKVSGRALATAALSAGLMFAALAPITSAQTVTPTVTSTPAVTNTPTPSAAGTVTVTPTVTGTPAASAPTATNTPGVGATATPNPSTPHDSRYYSQTGFRIDNDTFWTYFLARGGVPTFGYPTSRTFTFLGFTSQFFQRRVMQLDQSGNPRLLNLFDQGLFPYTNINGSTFPGPDPSVQGAAPVSSSATYSTDIISFIQNNAPNSFNGRSTNFYNTFASQVPVGAAFPNGGD